ncbi:helix-turn-helix domain-containing protein [Crateriforma conspicua]|uniref:Antitoxin HigA n=1 Tax=Crateriforma conspicua TaxID=2527996 RepID=A0A5C6FFR6_9PLAN|nr:helix-turn-helix transcriptional regulator [Crateriforma conspicua]TWU59602.1 Antitoxin HigA [Crateriforma conspicua]
MTGHKPWSTLTDKMSAESRKRIDEGVRQMKAEMLLAELRKHTGMTQIELAKVLGVSQSTLSEQEHRNDMEISTLSRYVAALGGSLEMVVHMPGGDIRLTQFERDHHASPEAVQ